MGKQGRTLRPLLNVTYLLHKSSTLDGILKMEAEATMYSSSEGKRPEDGLRRFPAG